MSAGNNNVERLVMSVERMRVFKDLRDPKAPKENRSSAHC